MEILHEEPGRSAQSWTNRAESKRPRKVDYSPELRSWLQRAILEAERNKDFNKKDQLLDLLKDL